MGKIDLNMLDKRTRVLMAEKFREEDGRSNDLRMGRFVYFFTSLVPLILELFVVSPFLDYGYKHRHGGGAYLLSFIVLLLNRGMILFIRYCRLNDIGVEKRLRFNILRISFLIDNISVFLWIYDSGRDTLAILVLSIIALLSSVIIHIFLQFTPPNEVYMRRSYSDYDLYRIYKESQSKRK